MIFDPFPPFVPNGFQIKYAVDAWEKRDAAALRRQVFCEDRKYSAKMTVTRSMTSPRRSLLYLRLRLSTTS